jgi:hypothetical protein
MINLILSLSYNSLVIMKNNRNLGVNFGVPYGNSFYASCNNNDYVNKIELLTDEDRLKGINLSCSDLKKELYVGSDLKNPSKKTILNCPMQGFTDLNVYEINENEINKSGIGGLGMYCRNLEYLKEPNDPRYYISTDIPPNSITSRFKCDRGGKIVGVSGTRNGNNITSLRFICDKDQNENNVNNIDYFDSRQCMLYLVFLMMFILFIIMITVIVIRSRQKINFNKIV